MNEEIVKLRICVSGAAEFYVDEYQFGGATRLKKAWLNLRKSVATLRAYEASLATPLRRAEAEKRKRG